MSDEPSKISAAISEAQNIIEAAEKRAEELLRVAEEKFKLASEQGHRKGLERGLEQATAQAVRMLEDNGALGEHLATEAARLAISIASTVVGEHISVNPQFVKSLAARGLQESIVGGSVIIRVNPVDAKVIKDNIKTLQRVARNASIAVDEDPDISRGGCVIQTEFGEVDAQVETLVKLVVQRFNDLQDNQKSE